MTIQDNYKCDIYEGTTVRITNILSSSLYVISSIIDRNRYAFTPFLILKLIWNSIIKTEFVVVSDAIWDDDTNCGNWVNITPTPGAKYSGLAGVPIKLTRYNISIINNADNLLDRKLEKFQKERDFEIEMLAKKYM